MKKVHIVSDKVDVTLLSKILDQYSCSLESLPTKEDKNQLVYNLENRYYTQIIYKQPKEYVAVAVKYYEKLERYEMCSQIIREVEEYMKLNGETIKTKLEEC